MSRRQSDKTQEKLKWLTDKKWVNVLLNVVLHVLAQWFIRKISQEAD